MVTRVFLILLAMMTGLSAAQAAESVRPANAPVSQATEARISGQVEGLEAADQRAASVSWLAFQPLWSADQTNTFLSLASDQAAPAPRTRRSDRARE